MTTSPIKHVTAARMLHPWEALEGAIERARACVPRGGRAEPFEREVLELAAHDIMRALVHARRYLREAERDVYAILDLAAHALGAMRARWMVHDVEEGGR